MTFLILLSDGRAKNAGVDNGQPLQEEERPGSAIQFAGVFDRDESSVRGAQGEIVTGPSRLSHFVVTDWSKSSFGGGGLAGARGG